MLNASGVIKVIIIFTSSETLEVKIKSSFQGGWLWLRTKWTILLNDLGLSTVVKLGSSQVIKSNGRDNKLPFPGSFTALWSVTTRDKLYIKIARGQTIVTPRENIYDERAWLSTNYSNTL